eukprot:1176223-Prorocentrum_minimum.AAC.11
MWSELRCGLDEPVTVLRRRTRRRFYWREPLTIWMFGCLDVLFRSIGPSWIRARASADAENGRSSHYSSYVVGDLCPGGGGRRGEAEEKGKEGEGGGRPRKEEEEEEGQGVKQPVILQGVAWEGRGEGGSLKVASRRRNAEG